MLHSNERPRAWPGATGRNEYEILFLNFSRQRQGVPLCAQRESRALCSSNPHDTYFESLDARTVEVTEAKHVAPAQRRQKRAREGHVCQVDGARGQQSTPTSSGRGAAPTRRAARSRCRSLVEFRFYFLLRLSLRVKYVSILGDSDTGPEALCVLTSKCRKPLASCQFFSRCSV